MPLGSRQLGRIFDPHVNTFADKLEIAERERIEFARNHTLQLWGHLQEPRFATQN